MYRTIAAIAALILLLASLATAADHTITLQPASSWDRTELPGTASKTWSIDYGCFGGAAQVIVEDELAGVVFLATPPLVGASAGTLPKYRSASLMATAPF